MNFTISIVIPVKNEAAGIRACLDSWTNQTIDVEEIVVIDSGSTDGTVEICRAYPQVKLVEIPGEEFNHGTTRNRAMREVTGELTLMTVGDGMAYDRRVLERMQRHFHDREVAGVCGMQVVPHHRDKNPIQWFRPQSIPVFQKVAFADPQAFDALPADKKLQAASWDDVIAMYRTNILRDHIPFKKITYGEDPVWAIDAIKAGHALIYDRACRVYHYHLEDKEITYKRSITMNFLRHRLFGAVPQPSALSIRSFLSNVKTLSSLRELSFREKFRWLRFTMANQRAMRRACHDFRTALKQGDAAIDQLHQNCTGKTFKMAA